MEIPNKIKNLKKLKKLVSTPKFIYFDFFSFKNNKKVFLERIQKNFKKKIIIRSASHQEDSNISQAGKFLSIANIDSSEKKEVELGVIKVFESYNKKNNQFIIVQEYINNAELVGVIFSQDLKSGAPFRTINFSKSKKTNLITSGKVNGQTIYYFKYFNKIKIKKKIKNIENILKKIEKKFRNDLLDIEFLISRKKIYILQVRVLKLKNKSNINFLKELKNLERKILKIKNQKSELIGKKRYFSTMTDWNPAEIIGLKPKPLAKSLYESLITDEIWSQSRVSLGYKNINKIPLMRTFFGTPYIDLKTDINSFLISTLSKKIQTKLINFYLYKFKAKPNYYFDKIESTLVINAISLNINKYKNCLSNSGLTKKELNEVIDKYTDLTTKIILKMNYNINKYKFGEKLYNKISTPKSSSKNDILELQSICKDYGTLPFANLARMAFIAVEFLNSFEDLNIITKKEKEHLLKTNRSISYEMNKTFNKSKSLFIEKYGHLRPNTYEITTLNYKENYKNYFKNSKINLKREKKFKFRSLQIQKINYFLKKNSFKNINANILINFIENSIYHRERSKLFFTKIVDKIFSKLKVLSKKMKLKESDIQYLDIKKNFIINNNFSNKRLSKILKENILINKRKYEFYQNFNMPNVILNEQDIYYFEEKEASPTFITDKIISSKFIFLKKFSKKLNLNNKIICIENADPGYDFIFNFQINGLITAFGGPNSHMSVRCNEYSIPAAIGVGEKKFQHLKDRNSLYLNCKKKILTII